MLASVEYATYFAQAVAALCAEDVAAIAASLAHVEIVSCRQVLEGRVAAAYSHLAVLELSRLSARSREHRQRQECVALTRAAARLSAPLPVVGASSDLAIADTSAAAALGYLGGAVDAPGSRTSWTTTVLFLELAHDDTRKAWRAARRFAAQADEESRRRYSEYQQSLRKIKSLQERLVQERRANAALQQEAVSAGVRASASTKQVALDNTAKLQEERAAAHRDSLRDMRMCVSYKFAKHATQAGHCRGEAEKTACNLAKANRAVRRSYRSNALRSRS